MKVELPELKRCCFCIPLRYGLLAMAYVKLMLMLIIGVFLTRTTLFFVVIALSFGGASYIQLVIAIITLLLTLLDIAFTIVFLVGGHQKNVKLLRVYSTYCIVCLCVFTLFILVTFGLGIYLRESSGGSEEVHDKLINYISFLRIQLFATLIIIGSHAYFFLLLRSEIIKLENNCNFRFVNNTGNEAGTLCTLENGTNANEHGTTTDKIKSGVHENGTSLTNELNVHNNETNGHDYTSLENATKEQMNVTTDVFKESESQSFNYKKLNNF